MIAIDVRPARQWFSNRRQWQYLITATNGEPISEKDTYALPVFDTGVESYIVTPATVLNDEPGHLGNAGVVR